MKEYIEKAKAIEALGEEPMIWSDDPIYSQEYFDWVSHKKALSSIHAADVVEVVRCKDCVYHDNKGEDVVFCANFLKDMIPDDYCSVGEREDQDED